MTEEERVWSATTFEPWSNARPTVIQRQYRATLAASTAKQNTT